MHTVIATVIGLLVLVLWLAVGRSLAWRRQILAMGFAGVWLLATIVHGAVGISHGQSLSTELFVGLVIYGIPLLALWWAMKSLAWPGARKRGKLD